MSKDFVIILIVILVTTLTIGLANLLFLKVEDNRMEKSPEIYAPLDGTLDIEFLKSLESPR